MNAQANRRQRTEAHREARMQHNATCMNARTCVSILHNRNLCECRQGPDAFRWQDLFGDVRCTDCNALDAEQPA